MAAPRGPGSTQEELLGISASAYVSPHWAQNVDVEGQIIKKLNYYPSMSQIRTFNPGQLSLLFYSIFQIFISKLDHNTTILHQAWSKYSKVSKK